MGHEEKCDSTGQTISGVTGPEKEPTNTTSTPKVRFGANVSHNYENGPGARSARPRVDSVNLELKTLRTVSWKSKGSKSHKAKKSPVVSKASNRNTVRGWKKSLSSLRDLLPCHVRGVQEPADCDRDSFSGVVKVEIRGRLNVSDAVGSNVAKLVSTERGETQMPGKIIGQRNRRDGKMEYTAVYLDSSKEVLTEAQLKRGVTIFTNATMSDEDRIKPIVVRLV